MITRRKLYMLTSIKITAQFKDSCMFIQKNKRPEISDYFIMIFK